MIYGSSAGVVGEYRTGHGEQITINNFTLEAPGAAALRAALAKDVAACRTFTLKTSTSPVYGSYVTKNAPTAISSGDLVGALTTEFYLAKNHKKFNNANQYIYAVTGRAFVIVTHNPSPVGNDVKGRDFSQASETASKQLVKLKAAFAS